jgi:transcriptional regulator with XRE-family HTH domain
MQHPAYPNHEVVGEELERLRTTKGLTQKEAAAVCGVGLRTYIDWEKKGINAKPLAAFDRLRSFATKGE